MGNPGAGRRHDDGEETGKSGDGTDVTRRCQEVLFDHARIDDGCPRVEIVELVDDASSSVRQ
jgi:hypothetical protein